MSLVLRDDHLILHARGVPLGDIVHSLQRELSITISGLESRQAQLVTFSGYSSSPDRLVRNLLHYLNERNYACEYMDERLTNVIVLSPGNETASQPLLLDRKEENQLADVVEIIGILEDSQAEKLGLKPGDYIVEYDGVRISRQEELIDASTRIIDSTPVNMIVLRDGELKSFYLERDFIGVRVRTKSIPMAVLRDSRRIW